MKINSEAKIVTTGSKAWFISFVGIYVTSTIFFISGILHILSPSDRSNVFTWVEIICVIIWLTCFFLFCCFDEDIFYVSGTDEVLLQQKGSTLYFRPSIRKILQYGNRREWGERDMASIELRLSSFSTTLPTRYLTYNVGVKFQTRSVEDLLRLEKDHANLEIFLEFHIHKLNKELSETLSTLYNPLDKDQQKLFARLVFGYLTSHLDKYNLILTRADFQVS